MSSETARPLRADAQLNHDRLLEAAARAFARDGCEASLKAIAEDAGVGIGTLYRRFPTRERLVEATYRNESTRLCAATAELMQSSPSAAAALRAWMNGFIDFMATKRGMADALHAVLVTEGDLRMRTRDLLTGALGALITAGIAEQTIRPDIDPNDVLMGLGGVALIAGEPSQRDLADRLLDLLMDGLRYRGEVLASSGSALGDQDPQRRERGLGGVVVA